MKIFLKIDTNDDSIYTVNINNQKYIINCDNSSIEITETVDKLSFTIQGKIERLTLKKMLFYTFAVIYKNTTFCVV